MMVKCVWALFLVLISCQAGCNELQALLPQVSPAPAGGGDSTLDVNDWILIEVAPIQLGPSSLRIHDLRDESTETTGLPPVQAKVLAFSISAKGVLAIATNDGFVRLVRIRGVSFDAERQLGALAVGWSNAGDRVAALVRGGTGSLRLEIVDANLESLSSREIDVTSVSIRGQPHDAYCISWSPDDSRIAVSTDVDTASGFVAEDCVITHPVGDEDLRFDASNVYFIASDAVAGHSGQVIRASGDGSSASGVPGSLFVFRIAGNQIVSETLLLEYRLFLRSTPMVLGSEPTEGLFVIREQDVPNIDFPFFGPIRVRHADGRHSRLLGRVEEDSIDIFGQKMALVPRGTIVPTGE